MTQSDWLPNESDIKFFEENGYWIAPKLIDDERLAQLTEHMDKVYNQEFETGKAPWQGYWRTGDNPRALRKTDNSHWADTVLRGLALDSRIGAVAAKLMQTNCIRLWHDQLLYKPGAAERKQESANVGWHQDYGYWQCAKTPTLLTAWVAFHDVDLSNGCMQVIPHSHKWGLVNVNDFFEQDLAQQQAAMNVPQGETFTPTPLIMKAGQVSFHHALTLHGSGPNQTDSARRSMAIHLMTGDTRYRAGTPSDRHMNVQLLQGNDDDLFAGAWFPVLYSE